MDPSRKLQWDNSARMTWTAPFLLSLRLLQAPYVPPEIKTALPPAHPVQTVEGGEVAFEVEVDWQGNIERLRLLLGRPPFTQAATEAVSQWNFTPARTEGPMGARVGIFMFFRQRALFTAGPAKHHYDWPLPEGDRASLPIDISYPSYPMNTVAEGVVILQLRISPSGSIENIRVVRDISPLTNAAQAAVQKWKFSPAQSSGRHVPGTAIVAISFRRPFVQLPAEKTNPSTPASP
jgi:TonB family protein